MLFRQLFDKTSSTYTYLISSGIGREALIIDPVLENVNHYIQLLKELDLNNTLSQFRFSKERNTERKQNRSNNKAISCIHLQRLVKV